MDVFLHTSLGKIYISESIRNIALSLIEIFVPIYLLQIGFPLWQVALYFSIACVTHILLAIPVGKLAARFGCSFSLLLGIPLSVLFFVLLSSLQTHHWPLYLLAIIGEAGSTFYWVSRHSLFARYTDDGKRGAQLGIAQGLYYVMYIGGALIGGIILSLFGIQLLIAIVSLLLCISTIPLFFIHEPKGDRMGFSLSKLSSGQSLGTISLFVAQGVDNIVNGTLWPIYIFFNILNTFVALGFVVFLQNLFNMIASYFTGKATDGKATRILQLGGAIDFVIQAIRFFLRTSMQVYVVDSFKGITSNLTSIPFNSVSYERANKNDIVPFIVFREMFIQSGQLIVFVALLIALNLKILFVFGLLYPLVYMFVKFNEVGPIS
jgi:MFS family permease